MRPLFGCMKFYLIVITSKYEKLIETCNKTKEQETQSLRRHTGMRRYACLIVHIFSIFKDMLGKVYLFLKLKDFGDHYENNKKDMFALVLY